MEKRSDEIQRLREKEQISKSDAILMAKAIELLEDLYIQTRCGCGHPACSLCEDDRETESVLNKAKGGEG